MLKIYKPQINELFFKQEMLADEQTMAYNHKYGGTISFPKEKWQDWYTRWLINNNNQRYYRYLKDDKDNFVGDIAYHYDEQLHIYLADVLIYNKYRHLGYGKQALNLLCELAKENGIQELYDNIAIDNNPAISLFLKQGFLKIKEADDYILVKKIL